MALWIEAWGIEAVVDQLRWYSKDPKTAWVLNKLTQALVTETGRFYTDRELGHLLAAHVPGGRVIEDEELFPSNGKGREQHSG